MKIFKRIKKILENPVIFNFFEKLMGIDRVRKGFSNNYVCPKKMIKYWI